MTAKNPVIGASVVAREKSSRLPGKSHVDLGGTPYNAGVVGLGNVGALYDRDKPDLQHAETHASAFQRYGRTRLLAGCDSDAERRKDFSAVRQIESVYESIDQMLASEQLDIVSIASPAELHAEMCLKALNAGVRAILCEKPFVTDIKQGKEVIQRARELKACIAVNHWFRWSTYYSNIKAFLQSGELGTIESIGCHYTKGAMNYGTYVMDLVRFYFGEFATVQASERALIDTGEYNIAGILELETGIPVFLTVNDYHLSDVVEFEFVGSAGRLTVTSDSLEFCKYEIVNAEEDEILMPAPFPVKHGEPFTQAVADLVSFLDNPDKEPACTADDGLRAVQVIKALERSANEQGKRIQIEY